MFQFDYGEIRRQRSGHWSAIFFPFQFDYDEIRRKECNNDPKKFPDIPIRLWWNQKSQSLFAKQRGAIVPIRLWWNQKSTSRMPRFIPASLFQFDYDEIRRREVAKMKFQFDYGEIRRLMITLPKVVPIRRVLTAWRSNSTMMKSEG